MRRKKDASCVRKLSLKCGDWWAKKSRDLRLGERSLHLLIGPAEPCLLSEQPNNARPPLLFQEPCLATDRTPLKRCVLEGRSQTPSPVNQAPATQSCLAPCSANRTPFARPSVSGCVTLASIPVVVVSHRALLRFRSRSVLAAHCVEWLTYDCLLCSTSCQVLYSRESLPDGRDPVSIVVNSATSEEKANCLTVTLPWKRPRPPRLMFERGGVGFEGENHLLVTNCRQDACASPGCTYGRVVSPKSESILAPRSAGRSSDERAPPSVS
jgi:hypothetical protein